MGAGSGHPEARGVPISSMQAQRTFWALSRASFWSTTSVRSKKPFALSPAFKAPGGARVAQKVTRACSGEAAQGVSQQRKAEQRFCSQSAF